MLNANRQAEANRGARAPTPENVVSHREARFRMLGGQLGILVGSLCVSVPTWFGVIVSTHFAGDFNVVCQTLVMNVSGCLAGLLLLALILVRRRRASAWVLLSLVLLTISQWLSCYAVDKVFIRF
jgi:hypothetical protein